MNRIALPSLALLAALAACDRTPAPPATPPAPEVPAAPAAPPSAEATPAAAAASGKADWQGYSAAQLGIDVEQLRTVWEGELQGDAAADGACYYLQPAGQGKDGVALMIEGNRFIRYDLRGGDEPAPGGGKVGMDLAQLQALYPKAEAPQPHKYVEGGKVLRVPAGDGSAGWLVFELGADGKASSWRVGLLPQVDYVEGCG